MVNFLAPPGNLMKPVAGSKEAVLPSWEMRTRAAFSSGDLVCTRSTSSSSPAGVTTALPSSQPRQGSGDGCDKGGDAHREREIRRGFQSVGKPRLVRDEEEGFGPLRAGARIEVGADDAVLRRAAFDGFRTVNWAEVANASDHGFSQRRLVVGILFIEVESLRLPVFVQAQAKIEGRLAL